MSPTRKRKKPASAARTVQARRGGTTRTDDLVGDDGRPAVVGIGASAGGLEALKAFFGAMPPNAGLVFVVVVHLDPTHDSLMPELLSHVTGLSVEQARDRQPLEPNTVLVIAPNRTLTIDQGLLRVKEVADRRSLRASIDHFFRSLAEAEGDRAVAIVLSGTGTEGTLGARAVKAAGGLVMAQTPETASQPGMPASVIATGLVDVVLPADKMPQALLKYVRNAPPHRPPQPAAQTHTLEGFPAILAVLRARTKYDFRGYKKGTLQRRIERRMGLQQIESVARYLEFLRSHPGEVDQLFKDLLIGVTSFFRDPPAFDELTTKVLAPLVRERDQDTPVRVWVPGCSTGEEAYSIAIVLSEQIASAQADCRVQIFATDVDDNALEIARAGAYPESIALDVSASRLQRFFVRDDHRYTISKSIRESVVFAVQNLTSDPPFSKLDLVSCRNVLIYLEPETQGRLLSLFHFALRPGGYLFLGSAEGVAPLEEMFTPISKRRRIFQRLGQGMRPPADLPMLAPPATDASRVGARHASEPTAAALADQLLLDHFAPTAVVVRSNGHIVRFYGPMERYITLPKGEATLDALTLARDALKPTLRAAFHEAVRRNRQTALETLDGQARTRTTLRITVKPLNGRTADRLWVVLFEEVAPVARVAARKATRGQVDLMRLLEGELRATKKEQRHLVEQLESSNEELKAANEEVLSMNEELQSTNEELITSKEELQSMNEELTTLNAQLLDKVHELTDVNDNLARADDSLARAREDLETRVADRTRWLALMHDVARGINEAPTWDEALHQVLRRLCLTEDWQIGFLYLPQPRHPETIAPIVSCFGDERFRRFHDLSMQQTYVPGDRLPGRVYVENEPFWAEDTDQLMTGLTVRAEAAAAAGLRAGVVLPVTVRHEVVAVLELFSTLAHPASGPLMALMQNVSDQIGRVLERERATARMADLVWREQQELLHNLHDSLGQTLTGLGMLSTGLGQHLGGAEDPAAADTAAEIARQTQQALDQVRQLAKNFFPVDVDSENLMAALRDLAAATTSLHRVDVQVDGEPPASLRDGKIATELYRIAQEAVTNSLKHGRAKTISIRLDGANGLTQLQIADDGVGISHPTSGDGMGLRIMRHRAASIGASLSVERGSTGGTVVTCALRERPVPDRGDA